MYLYLVRHGDPDYKNDCLTPLGKKQAEAVGDRIALLKPDHLYTSPMGRASETSIPSAQKTGLPVTTLEFLHEIKSGIHGLPAEEKAKYSPWLSSQVLAAEGVDLLRYDFSEHFAWKGTRFEESVGIVTEGFDAWMSENGFTREGLYYRCTRPNDEKNVFFAHGGSISCIFAHLLNLPVQYICAFQDFYCTSITSIRFDAVSGALSVPRMLSVNDCFHIETCSAADEAPQE